MENYVIIKELPDANIGTDVIWNEGGNYFSYKKSAYVSPNDTTYLTRGQVTQTPEYFIKAGSFGEYYAYKHPVYSRYEILQLIKESFPNKLITGAFKIYGSKELHNFKEKLRELGKVKGKEFINKEGVCGNCKAVNKCINKPLCI